MDNEENFRRDCDAVAWFWLQTEHEMNWEKNYKCISNRRGAFWWVERCRQRFLISFILFFLVCRFFQLLNGLHNSSKNIALKEVYFILSKKLRFRTILNYNWLFIFVGYNRRTIHFSNADVSSIVILSFHSRHFVGNRIDKLVYLLNSLIQL